jgi:hypothetical protein
MRTNEQTPSHTPWTTQERLADVAAISPPNAARVHLLTPTMWALLRYAARRGPAARIGGSWLLRASYLERDGLLSKCECSDGGCAVRLTPAGAEALIDHH